MTHPASSRRSRHWLWLLLLPFIGLLWVPWYNRTEPQWAGFPFFYWYQFAWVLVSALLTLVVYRASPSDDTGQDDALPQNDSSSAQPSSEDFR
jgi:hypothetical protein